MLDGCWKACHSIDDETGQPFAADAIISNPPTFAHVHCAEALGVPLTMTFSTFHAAHNLTSLTIHTSYALVNYLIFTSLS